MRDNKQAVEALRAEKQALRCEYRSVRASVTPEQKAEYDRLITAHILGSLCYRYGKKLLVYASFGDEADTYALVGRALAEGRQLYYPKTYAGGVMRFFEVSSQNALIPGRYGIAEPSDDAAEYVPSIDGADLCLVPGLCFDAFGYRIGYGKGYYDRFLTKFPGVAVGLAYDVCLRTAALPREKRYDRHVDFIITEKGMKPIVCP